MPDSLADHRPSVADSVAISDSITVVHALPPTDSADIIYRTNNEGFTIVPGRPVKFDGTTGCKLAQADDPANTLIGVVMETTASGASTKIKLLGTVTVADWTIALGGGSADLTPNAYYYLSQGAAGILTTIAPSGTGQIWQPMGFAISTRDLFLQIQTLIIA